MAFSTLRGVKGSELKALRESTGYSQVAFADKLGMHAITLSRYERDAEPIPRLVELAIPELLRRLTNGSKPKK